MGGVGVEFVIVDIHNLTNSISLAKILNLGSRNEMLEVIRGV